MPFLLENTARPCFKSGCLQCWGLFSPFFDQEAEGDFDAVLNSFDPFSEEQAR